MTLWTPQLGGYQKPLILGHVFTPKRVPEELSEMYYTGEAAKTLLQWETTIVLYILLRDFY